jgi:hypothetical protein
MNSLGVQDNKSHLPPLPPSPPPGQEANEYNIEKVEEASRMRDVLPKFHHVSHDALDFMKARGINGLMSEESFEYFHPQVFMPSIQSRRHHEWAKNKVGTVQFCAHLQSRTPAGFHHFYFIRVPIKNEADIAEDTIRN